MSRRTTATAWVLNESTYEKSYDGLELPLGPAPVCGLKSLLCKEGRLVVPLAVSFCFFLRADANSVRARGSAGDGGGALGSSQIARALGGLTAPTHHTLAPSSLSQVNGYISSRNAMGVQPRYHASRGGQCASRVLLGSFGGLLLAEKGQVAWGWAIALTECSWRV